MDVKKRTYLSIGIKITLIISVIVGFVINYYVGHLSRWTSLLYFTVQSNFWMALMDAILVFFLIRMLKRKETSIDSRLYVAQIVFTVSITITGLVFCFILAPGMYINKTLKPIDYSPFTFQSVLHHVVNPILSIIDLLVLTRTSKISKKNCFLGVIPPLYYLIFALIGFFLNWDFGDNQNYPYFFLNYNSPAGLFGTSDICPYYIGNFYYILLLLILVVSLSLLYIFLVNKINLKSKKKEA